jgi:hypothetical protein
VHVRAGDSCDISIRAANRAPWALWPLDPRQPKGVDWNGARRYCVHPAVHLDAVKALVDSGRKVAR